MIAGLSPIVDVMGWPLAALCGLAIGLCIVAVILHILEKWPGSPLKDELSRTYQNETVVLDGRNFIDCTFLGCTLVLKKKKFGLDGCRFDANCKFQFEQDIINRAVMVTLDYCNSFKDGNIEFVQGDKYGRIETVYGKNNDDT